MTKFTLMRYGLPVNIFESKKDMINWLSENVPEEEVIFYDFRKANLIERFIYITIIKTTKK